MKRLAVPVIALLVIGAMPEPARAAPIKLAPTFVYSVKFLCGLQTTPSSSQLFPPPTEPAVKPGNYATAVNVHNFHRRDVVFVKKAVLALPELQGPPNQPGPFVKGILGPDQALEVDCTDIVKELTPPGIISGTTFIKGFVEIVSPAELSVVGVYTSQTCHNPTPIGVAPCSDLGELELEVVPQRSFAP